MSATARPTNGTTKSFPGRLGIGAGQEPASRECRHERLLSAKQSSRRTSAGRGLGAGRLRHMLDQELSDRDLRILCEVDRHGCLTTHHIERLCFAGHASAESAGRTARRVLARLHRERLLDKPLRRVGGRQAGSTVTVWMLSGSGKRLLNLHAGLGAVGRARQPGDRSIDHHLAVADAHVVLVEAEHEGLIAVETVQIEPECWRTFTALSGTHTILKPDLFAITSPADHPSVEDHWFFEVDRATETIPTVLRQCRRYEVYRNQGDHTDVFPIVVWIVPDTHRAEQLRGGIRRGSLTNELYRVVTADQLIPLVATGDGGAV